MAKARSVVGGAVIVRQKYFWPDAQLNIWTLIMLLTGCLELGIFAEFMQIQNQMRLGTPWYAYLPFPIPTRRLITDKNVVQVIPVRSDSWLSYRCLHPYPTDIDCATTITTRNHDARIVHIVRLVFDWRHRNSNPAVRLACKRERTMPDVRGQQQEHRRITANISLAAAE